MADNQSDPPTRGLTAFPHEILRLICASLCTHCTSNALSTDSIDWGDERWSQRPLLALSQTCRVLRDIAQPMAYHTVAYIPGYTQFPNFIRTLDERPDLAAQIRWLRQSRYECGGWDAENEDQFTLLKDVAKRLGMQRETDEDFESAEEEDTSPGKFCIELVIALSPNVEVLEVYVEDDNNYEGTKYYYMAERCRQIGLQNASLHRLKRLSLVTDESWGVSANVPAIPVLLSVAPNLEFLSLSRCKGLSQQEEEEDSIFPDGAGSSLRIVQLDNCALEGDANTDRLIADIVSHAPNLEYFAYDSQSAYLGEHIEDHFSARAFLRRLRPAQHSLKFLDINLTKHSLRGSSDLVKPHVLQGFTALETIKLDETAFCRHRDNREAPTTCITAILPESVKNLVLRLYEDTCAWADLEQLAADIGKYPNLERVRVDNILRMHSGANREDFSRSCKEHGNMLDQLFTQRNIDFSWSKTE